MQHCLISSKGYFRTAHLALTMCFGLLLSFGSAQTAMPQAAQAALVEGQRSASAALATYDVHYLDKPLWKEAIEYGLEAQRLRVRHVVRQRPRPCRFGGVIVVDPALDTALLDPV